MTTVPAYNVELAFLNISGTVLAAGLGAGLARMIVSDNVDEKYKKLKPTPISPPAWLFGVVWTVLYILMGVCAYLVRMKGGACYDPFASTCDIDNRRALVLYWVLQGVLALYLFVGLGRQNWFFWGTLVVLASLVLSIVVVYYFWKISVTAGVLMLALCAWLTFALVLSVWVWINNAETQVRLIGRTQSGAAAARKKRAQRPDDCV
jgi:benzodiazapine receptor